MRPTMTDDIAQHYRHIITALGENPDREGLRDTPKR
ncbi:GTP cyclohydrolase, partial [Halomonas sp. SUBG004]